MTRALPQVTRMRNVALTRRDRTGYATGRAAWPFTRPLAGQRAWKLVLKCMGEGGTVDVETFYKSDGSLHMNAKLVWPEDSVYTPKLLD